MAYITGLPSASDESDPFIQGLRDLGYIEGKNVILDIRRPEPDADRDRLKELVSDILASKADVIVSDASVYAITAKGLTNTVPIVFMYSSDPVLLGLVTDLARPGGNVTGFTNGQTLTIRKQLEMLLQIVSGLSQVGALLVPDNPAAVANVKAIETAAQALSVNAQVIDMRQHSLEGAFQVAVAAKSEALIIPVTPALSGAAIDHIDDLAVKYHLPTIGNLRTRASVLGYGANVADLDRRSADYVDRILRGAKPADLPVELPTKFDLYVNLKLAKNIGVTVPPALLAQATEVIQ